MAPKTGSEATQSDQVAVKVAATPGGGHEVSAGEFGFSVVTVRPVGLLELPEHIQGPFAPEHVPELVAALQVAYQIANRERPWEPWGGTG